MSASLRRVPFAGLLIDVPSCAKLVYRRAVQGAVPGAVHRWWESSYCTSLRNLDLWLEVLAVLAVLWHAGENYCQLPVKTAY